jgi:hypothetical protein
VAVGEIMRDRHEASTSGKYRGHFDKFMKWATLHAIFRDGWLRLPTEVELIFFAEFLQRSSKAGNVKGTLSGIASEFMERGFPNPLLNQHGNYLPRLQGFTRAIKRRKGGPSQKRRGLTVNKVERIGPCVSEAVGGCTYNALMFWSALTNAVYQLLRVSEFTSPGVQAHDPTRRLNLEDIELLTATGLGANRERLHEADVMDENIKWSKTDGWRQGIQLRVFANGTSTCPVAAMAKWLKVRRGGGPKSPLYNFADGSFLTRDRFQRTLKKCVELAGYSSAHYTTHSCRIGGATSLACAGQPAETIQMLGRWSSDCYTRYLRMDDARRRRMSKAMSEVVAEDHAESKERGEVDALDRWSGSG